MRTVRLGVFNILIFSQVWSIGCAQEQPDYPEKEVISELSEFYSAYLIELTKIPLRDSEMDSIKKQYCSKKLYNQLRSIELDYDPFLNAQDYDDEIERGMIFGKLTHNTFYVSYKNHYDQSIIEIRLCIIYEDGKYKIDSIVYPSGKRF